MMSSTKQPTTVKQPTQSVCQSQATTNKTQQQPTSQYNNTTGDPSQSQQPSKKPGTVTDDGGYDNLNPNSKPMSGPIPQ
uniref:Secreted protein n=1 Tax=Panagrellus redivivus TaxID=6233 RepID=A0A7E4VNX7_PANRE